MEQNPDLTDTELTERPKNLQAEGRVKEYKKGTQAEMYNLDEDEEPQYGDREDERLRLTIEVETDEGTFEVYEDMAFYDTPSERSKFGRYMKRYGVPETGQTVNVDFDEEGDAEVLL